MSTRKKLALAAAAVVLALAGARLLVGASPPAAGSARPDARNEARDPAPRVEAAGVELEGRAAPDRSSPTSPTSPPATAPTHGGTLLVQVRSAGHSVSGARVTAVRLKAGQGNDALRGRTTDGEGRVALDVPAGVRLRIEVEPDRAREDPADPVASASTETAPLAPGERRAIAVELARGSNRHFWGRTVADEDGRPLAGVAVRTHRSESQRVDPYAAVTTDSDGLFELPYASWRRTQVVLSAADRGPAVIELGPGHELAHDAFEARLTRAASLELRLVGEHGLAPPLVLQLAAATRDLVQPTGTSTSGPGREWRATLDERAGASVSGLPARVRVVAELVAGGARAWGAAEPLVLEPGERRLLELDLQAGLWLSGTLRDETGAPVVARELWVLPVDAKDPPEQRGFSYLEAGDAQRVVSRARTDETGRYELTGLAPGRWWIGPAPPPSSARAPVLDDVPALAVPVTVAGGERQRALDLVLPRGRFARGRVVGPEGQALKRHRVSGFAREAHGRVMTLSTGDGRFVLGPLGAWEHWLCSSTFGAVGQSELVRATPGGGEVELVFGAGAALAGQVVDDRTGERTDAHVHLVLPGRGSYGMRSGGRDAGRFRFVGLDAGVYHLRASTTDGRVAVLSGVEVEAGEHLAGLELRLHPGGRLRVHLRGPEEALRCELSIDGQVLADFTARRGAREIVPVPAGRIRATAYAAGREVRDERYAVVGSGELADLDLGREE